MSCPSNSMISTQNSTSYVYTVSSLHVDKARLAPSQLYDSHGHENQLLKANLLTVARLRLSPNVCL